MTLLDIAANARRLAEPCSHTEANAFTDKHSAIRCLAGKCEALATVLNDPSQDGEVVATVGELNHEARELITGLETKGNLVALHLWSEALEMCDAIEKRWAA